MEFTKICACKIQRHFSILCRVYLLIWDDMDTSLLLQALLIGLSIAAPVGPIALLCMQTTLQHGWRAGLLAGLGAASADACYGLIGALGLQTILHWFINLQLPLTLGGAGFMIYLALQIWRTASKSGAPTAKPAAPVKAAGQSYLKVLLLTLSNPMTILSFVAIFASLNPANSAASAGQAAILMVSGVFLGSTLWWLILVSVVAAGKHKLSQQNLVHINRSSAILLAGFALWQILKLV